LISGKVSLSQNCALLLPKSDEIEMLYLHYVLPSLLEIKKAGIPSDMQASLRFADLSQFWLHWPDVEVQSQIAKEISTSEKYVISMNDLIKRSIDLLEEYKSSLITQAITGNLDNSSGKGAA
jgi:restriction endonuclease S subunit